MSQRKARNGQEESSPSHEDNDLINQYLGGEDGDSAAIPNDNVIEDMFKTRETVHADDAIDYEDIDELAEDEEVIDLNVPISGSNDNEQYLEEAANQEYDDIFGDDDDMGDAGNDRLLDGGLDNDHLMDPDNLGDLNVSEIYGGDLINHSSEEKENIRKRRIEEDEDRQFKRSKLQQIVQKLEQSRNNRFLQEYFPSFRPDRPFNNHKLFLGSPKFYKYKIPPIAYKPKPLIPTKVSLEPEIDQKKLFKTGKQLLKYISTPNVTDITELDLKLLEKITENGGLDRKRLVPLDYLTKDGSNSDKFHDYEKDLILATADWDDDAIINGKGKSQKALSINQDPIDVQMDDDDEEEIFLGNINHNLTTLDMNDPTLLFERLDKSDTGKDKSKIVASIPASDKLLNLKFNISNDQLYDILKSNYQTKVRSQIGNLNIEHSIPAIRLQSPYYKVKLSKEDARAFHRPKFSPRPGTLISFLKTKARKKKKDKGKTSKELFSKTTDLTVGDNATLIGVEYTEEYPMILSNYGMGSKLINYYRREKPDDNYRPKAPLGETHVLGVEDRSPFWNFGSVQKGDFVPTLYNNMIRAPIFKHEKKSTDFLLVKSQGGGSHQKYFLKNLDHVFAVGHTFPSVEIPAPHSRKVTNTSKNRLKMIVFRTMNKKGKARINVKDISHHFPDQNDMQNRQRLKEFMEYQRSGEDQYYWKIKNSDTVPDEDSIRSMITPEDVTLLDSMQSGQQVLDDLTIFLDEEQIRLKALKAQENEELKEKDKKDTDEGIDEQLSCWNLTRNFVLANQTKSMLQLNGEGDPTGIGIGYSFLKTSQKSSFTPYFPPPKENVPKSNQAAYQQRLYEKEVNRIWLVQRKSLTVDPNSPVLNLDQVYSQYKPLNHQKYLRKKYQEIYDNQKSNNEEILRINRRFRDKNGIVQRRVEVIKDPRIIKAYLRRKKQIEDDLIKNADLEDIIPTNDKELNKIRRKALEEKLANLERRAKHHKGRKPNQTGKEALQTAIAAGGRPIDANTVVLPDGSYAIGGKGIGKGKSQNRRCKACGAYGHIRTKKSCPLYNQTKGGTIDIESSQDPTDGDNAPGIEV